MLTRILLLICVLVWMKPVLGQEVLSPVVQGDTTANASHVQEQPEYPGGVKGMFKYLRKNIRYPKEVKKAHIEGRVYVEFVVEKDGSVNEVSVRRSLHPLLDAEVVRVIGSMPKWSPGKMDGKPVRCQFTMPVIFPLM